MAKRQTVLQVFIASPSDVNDERLIVKEVINEYNIATNDDSILLEPVSWETHTHPGIGKDPQDVINNQIGDSYDIFIGIMWSRFGTSTKRALSGTVEEFERALNRFSSSENIQILFYFKDKGIPLSQIDVDQLKKVQDFKHRISSDHGGLYHVFESKENFRKDVSRHLRKAIHSWVKNENTKIDSLSEPLQVCSDPILKNFLALPTDESQHGLIELEEIAEQAMSDASNVLGLMSDSLNVWSSNVNKRLKEIAELNESEFDRKILKNISNKSADDLEEYIKHNIEHIPELNKYSALFLNSLREIAILKKSEFEPDESEMYEDKLHVANYRSEVESTCKELVDFRDSIAAIPRLTSKFNRARRRAVAILDDLIETMNDIISKASSIEDLIDNM